MNKDIEQFDDIVESQRKEIERLKEENKTLSKTLKEAKEIAEDFISEENQLKLVTEFNDIIKDERQAVLKEFISELKDQIKAVDTIFSHTDEHCKQTDGLIRTGLDIALRKMDETAEKFLGGCRNKP